MALTTPSLYPKVAFDATKAEIFKFNVVGGDQVVANRLIIKDGVTEVYNQKQVTFVLSHVVNQNLLVNGKSYTAQVQTYNVGDVGSYLSPAIRFYCYSNPSFVFTNFPQSQVITSSVFKFDVRYSQAQGELLDSYSFTLYDENKTQISTSGIKYIASTVPPPTNLSYQFNGFVDNRVYYISADGITVGGTSITTGKILFNVDYANPEIFSKLELTNDACNGWVQIKSNMTSIPGESNPSPPIYIKNKKVDLTANGSWVRWTTEYTISDDFTAKIWIENAKLDSNVLSLSNSNTNENIKLFYRNGIDYGKTVSEAYYDCFVTQGINQPYYIYSNFIPIPSNADQIFVWLRRINNIYELKIENKGVVV